MEGEEEAGEKAQGVRVMGKVCDSVTQNVQFDVICRMISYKGYLIKLLEFSEVWSERRRKKSKRRLDRRNRRSKGHGGRERAGEKVNVGRQREVSVNYCL